MPKKVEKMDDVQNAVDVARIATGVKRDSKLKRPRKRHRIRVLKQ